MQKSSDESHPATSSPTRSRSNWTRAIVVVIAAVTLLSLLSAAGAGVAVRPGSSGAPATVPIAAAPTPVAPAAIPAAPAAPSVAPNGELGHFNLAGPHPSSWAKSGVPPGWEALGPSGHPSAGIGTNSSSNWLNRFCAGLWPGGPANWAQSYYEGDCYGHDEPGVNFYSTLAGSGGNVTWQVTLPVDRSPTDNQSNLYAAIWFGMTLSDRLGWMDQCFLELQFYPDQTWYNPGPLYPNATVNGDWIAAAVAWQIESATGFEDPCFYEPAYLNGIPGPAFLNMTQGDQLTITMSGWQTNPTGELITIVDNTNGQQSSFVLFDSTGGYPLNPAYKTSSYPNSLQWTPGGEYPVSFAFETGHAGNPDWPGNNSYGGCSGGPKSTPVDPGAPCPSYDPGSWANDSLHPWIIDTPTFWNAKASAQASQVAFTQPEGGISLVDQTSNGVCNGSEGSAWCSYPWYSYYCNIGAFEFGALDYPLVTTDFGKYTQFSSNEIADQSGIGFFGPTNFSIPTCAAPSYSVTVGTSGGVGSAYFLSHPYVAATTVSGLGSGSYSLSATPAPGGSFGGWATTGGVTVQNPLSPWTTLDVTGSGTVTADFSGSPAKTAVTFSDQPGGSIGVNPTPFLSGNGAGLATVANGHALTLAAGLYPVEAYPRVGYEFSHWTTSGTGLTVAAPQFPITWLLVDGSSATGHLTAHYVASADTAGLYVVVQGVGTIKLGSVSVTNTVPGGENYVFAVYSVGSYALTLTPGPHTFASEIEYFFPVIAMMNFATHSRLTLENGTSEIVAIFVPGAHVHLATGSAGGGSIVMVNTAGFQTLGSGTTLSLASGEYEWIASPAAHYTFVGWSTNNPTDATFLTPPTSPFLAADVNGPSAITAHFVRVVGTAKVTFSTTAGSGGGLSFNFGAAVPGGTSFRVAPGEYFVTSSAATGWLPTGWGSSGAVSLLATGPGEAIVLVAGNGGLGSSFGPATFLVSFVVYTHGGTVNTATVTVSSTVLATGETAALTYGWHTLTLTATSVHVHWRSTANIGLGSGGGFTLSFFVSGAGTVYAHLW